MKKFLKTEPDPAFARRAEIIIENLELKKGDKVIDIGCGRGFYINFLSQLNLGLEIFGIDQNEKYLKVAKKNLGGKKVFLNRGNALNLPFKANFFDKVIASEILEHINDDVKALEEMYRVLKPGGIILISVPNQNYPFFWDPLNWTLERVFRKHIPSHLWWLAGIWADHVRLYKERELKEKLKKAGFRIKGFWCATHFCFPFSHFILYGIGKNLVEKGLLKDFNRFYRDDNQSFFNKILLWPARKIDFLNSKDDYKVSVNLICKAIK
ncbi:class I SAM-dependent methyltransferase [Candidatus Microgenomates bacterium]|jgi:ubiquinone/menaquinone biosynthesis C-methylase UbiE|nr:MAG: class I SAM-dependent methyltransferase [Candidatus Microgenomates bacterium]